MIFVIAKPLCRSSKVASRSLYQLDVKGEASKIYCYTYIHFDFRSTTLIKGLQSYIEWLLERNNHILGLALATLVCSSPIINTNVFNNRRLATELVQGQTSAKLLYNKSTKAVFILTATMRRHWPFGEHTYVKSVCRNGELEGSKEIVF